MAVFDDEKAVRGGEGFDAFVEGGWFGEVAEGEPGGEVLGRGAEGETSGAEGFDFGGEDERAVVGTGEVEGFLATAVTGEKEGVVFRVVDGEGEHSVEFFWEVDSPFKPCGGKDLAVAGGVKAVAFLFEFMAELFPIKCEF